ncbi:MAG: YoaK family protein [Bacteroidia bacterium]
MFTHQGSERTYEHNFKVATLLSFVAGVVNVVGFLSVQKLTTNVTGHFAFFVDDILALKLYDSLIFFLYIFAFFFGAFVSNFLVEIIHKKNEKNIFVMPIALEIIILFLLGLLGNSFYSENPNTIAISLLFAMGLQNSLVTKISNAVVRTTHLTGLFTDLGIEISQLFFYTSKEQKEKLLSTIGLRMTIITFFFIGGIVGGLIFAQIKLHTLIIPALLLAIGLVYDHTKFKILRWTENHSTKKHVR